MRKLFAIIGLVVVCLSAGCDNAGDASVTDRYNKMFEAAQVMPKDFDFAAARDLYAQLPGYRPHEIYPVAQFGHFFQRVRSGDPYVGDEVVKYTGKYFPLPQVHTRAFVVFMQANDVERMRYHEWAAKGFMDALAESGDGNGPDTAYKILVLAEADMIVEHRLEELSEPRRAHGGDRVFAVFAGKDKETGEERKLWFDVTAIERAPDN